MRVLGTVGIIIVAAAACGGTNEAIEDATAAVQSGVAVVAHSRLMVVVTGESVPDLDTVRTAASAIDLQKMAALK